MINKEVLKKVNNGILTADAINGQTTKDDALIEEVIRIFSQVKTLLRCETCNGTKQVRKVLGEIKGLPLRDYVGSKIPCPDCSKEQPPARGLTKECREYLKIGQLEDDMNCYYIANLCDYLDASEASRKELLAACEEAQKVFSFIAENYKSCPHFPNAERLVDSAIINANK